MRQSLGEAFDQSLKLNAANVAIEFGAQSITYAELDDWVAAVAAQFADLGIGPGDPVAVYLRNDPAFFAVDLAIARLGAVKVPLNYMLPTSTVQHCLQVSRARLLVTSTRLASAARSATAELPGLTVLEHPDDGTASPDSANLLVGQPSADTTPTPVPERGDAVTPESPAALYFTGGTTGLPKGVLHSQSSTLSFHYAQLLEAEILADERLLLMTPLAHAAGLFGGSALIRGATIVLTDGFDADDTARQLTDGAVTWVFLVPTMIYRLIDVLTDQPKQDFALRTIVYGAAPIAPTRLEQGLKLFGRVFVQLYGQTESPNWGTRLAKKDHDVNRPQLLGSCGQASIMADVKIVDDEGKTLGPNETGEICLRTPYLLDRYVDAPEATREKFLDGWIRTGDIGLLDAAGYLFLLDRKSDMVISGGMNVYCREVEDVLASHPLVKAVAVIGIPHPDWGEAVHAVVVPRDEFDADQVIEWTRGKLAGYARPKTIEVADTLPETPFGKVDKKVLRAPYWSAQARAIG